MAKKFDKYLAASVAAKYVEQKDFGRAGIFLDKFVEVADEDFKEWMKRSDYGRTQNGVIDAANVWGSVYQERLGELKFSELFEYYSGYISQLPEEKQKKLKEIFGKEGDKKLGDVKKDFFYAAQMVQNPGLLRESMKRYGEVNDEKLREEIQKLDRYINKYKPLMDLMNLAHEKKTSALEDEVRNTRGEQIVDSMVA